MSSTLPAYLIEAARREVAAAPPVTPEVRERVAVLMRDYLRQPAPARKAAA